MRSLAVVLLVAAAGAGCLGDGHESPRVLPPPTELSCIQPCGTIVDAPAQPTTEMHAAVDPADPAHVVVGATTFEATGPGDTRWLYAYVTRDAGLTWSATRLPGGLEGDPEHPLAPYARAVDPSVAILLDGTVVYAGVALAGGTAGMALAERRALFIARSHDGGATFDETHVLVEETGALVIAPAVQRLVGPWDLPDKAMLARGPNDELLLVWTRVQNAEGGVVGLTDLTVHSSTSADGGRTWTEPAALARGYGAAPLVGTDGTWLVAYLVSEGDATHLWFATSTDGGETWAMGDLGPAAPSPFPNLAVHGSGTGDAVALAYGILVGESRQPVLRISADGARSWDEPRLLSNATGEERTQVHPTVAWDGAGGLHVAWSEPRNGTDTYEGRALALLPCAPGSDGCEGGWRQLGPITLDPILTTGHWSYHYRASVGLPASAMHLWMVGSYPDLDVRSVKMRLG